MLLQLYFYNTLLNWRWLYPELQHHHHVTQINNLCISRNRIVWKTDIIRQYQISIVGYVEKKFPFSKYATSTAMSFTRSKHSFQCWGFEKPPCHWHKCKICNIQLSLVLPRNTKSLMSLIGCQRCYSNLVHVNKISYELLQCQKDH